MPRPPRGPDGHDPFFSSGPTRPGSSRLRTSTRKSTPGPGKPRVQLKPRMQLKPRVPLAAAVIFESVHFFSSPCTSFLLLTPPPHCSSSPLLLTRARPALCWWPRASVVVEGILALLLAEVGVDAPVARRDRVLKQPSGGSQHHRGNHRYEIRGGESGLRHCDAVTLPYSDRQLACTASSPAWVHMGTRQLCKCRRLRQHQKQHEPRERRHPGHFGSAGVQGVELRRRRRLGRQTDSLPEGKHGLAQR